MQPPERENPGNLMMPKKLCYSKHLTNVSL